MADKHSTACFRPVPSVSSYRIIKKAQINGEQNIFTTIILVGACYLIIRTKNFM